MKRTNETVVPPETTRGKSKVFYTLRVHETPTGTHSPVVPVRFSLEDFRPLREGSMLKETTYTSSSPTTWVDSGQGTVFRKEFTRLKLFRGFT